MRSDVGGKSTLVRTCGCIAVPGRCRRCPQLRALRTSASTEPGGRIDVIAQQRLAGLDVPIQQAGDHLYENRLPERRVALEPFAHSDLEISGQLRASPARHAPGAGRRPERGLGACDRRRRPMWRHFCIVVVERSPERRSIYGQVAATTGRGGRVRTGLGLERPLLPTKGPASKRRSARRLWLK